MNAAQALTGHCWSELQDPTIPISWRGGDSVLGRTELHSAAFGVSEGCKGPALSEQWVGVLLSLLSPFLLHPHSSHSCCVLEDPILPWAEAVHRLRGH